MKHKTPYEIRNIHFNTKLRDFQAEVWNYSTPEGVVVMSGSLLDCAKFIAEQ